MIGKSNYSPRRKRATSTVTAISEFECIAIDSEICAAELKTNIPFSNKLGTTLAEKLERSTDNYVLSALCSAEERLCTYILQNAPTGLFRDVLTDVACSSVQVIVMSFVFCRSFVAKGSYGNPRARMK